MLGFSSYRQQPASWAGSALLRRHPPGALLIAHLESIVSVSLLEIDAIGIAQQWPQGIGSNDLAMLAADGIRISLEIAEVVA
jgi:hypothetical protein